MSYNSYENIFRHDYSILVARWSIQSECLLALRAVRRTHRSLPLCEAPVGCGLVPPFSSSPRLPRHARTATGRAACAVPGRCRVRRETGRSSGAAVVPSPALLRVACEYVDVPNTPKWRAPTPSGRFVTTGGVQCYVAITPRSREAACRPGCGATAVSHHRHGDAHNRRYRLAAWALPLPSPATTAGRQKRCARRAMIGGVLRAFPSLPGLDAGMARRACQVPRPRWADCQSGGGGPRDVFGR